MKKDHKNKIRYLFTFSVLNGFLLFLITLRFSSFANLNPLLETVFYLTSVIFSNSFLISFVISILFFAPLLIFNTNRKIISIWQILIASVGITILLLDYEVYAQYRVHLNELILKMVVFAGDEIFHFSWYTWGITIVAVIIIIFIEYFINKLSIKLSGRDNIFKKAIVVPFILIWLLSIGGSHFTHAKADVTIYRPITSLARHIPLYYPLTMKRFLTKNKIVDLDEIQNMQEFKLDGNSKGAIKYPKSELKFDGIKDSLNIVVLVLDCWRFDMLTNEITPNIYKFSNGEGVLKFNKHYSGGNGTRIGLFSLFYGLYGTYWNTMSDEQIGPVLMNEILGRDYQVGIFASSTLTIPPFNRTIFKDVENLRTGSPGTSASEKDLNALSDWSRFMAKRKKDRPFFSFLFFDSIHAYDIPEDYPKVFTPYWDRIDHVKLNNSFNPTPYLNRYKTSTHFVDSMVGKILKRLRDEKLDDKTMIIITGDHGEEFNENQKNYWGHGGNYTPYQVQVPLLIRFPGRKKQIFEHWTNHLDVPPTIMEEVFSVKNSPSDYSNGKSLLDADKRDWMVSGGYFNYAIIEDDIITLSFPSGAYEVQDHKGNVLDRDINYEVFKEVLVETTRFYQ